MNNFLSLINVLIVGNIAIAITLIVSALLNKEAITIKKIIGIGAFIIGLILLIR